MNNSYIGLCGKAYELLCKSSGENKTSLSDAFCAGYKKAEEDRAMPIKFKKAITYLSEQIDGDNPTLDQTLSQAIRILEGNDL